MSLHDRYQSMDQNARAAAAQQYIGAAAAKLRPGLEALGDRDGRGEGVGAEPILLYPSDIGFNPHQASYILFTGHSVTHATVVKGRTKLQIQEAAAKRIQHQEGEGTGQFLTHAESLEIERNLETERLKHTGIDKDSNSILLRRRNVIKSGTVIGLYMPPSVNVSYSMDYAEGEIGTMGEMLYGILKDYQATGQFGESVSKNLGIGAQGIEQKGLSIIDAVIPGVKDLAAIERGTIYTPKMELMFRGIGRRQFSFEFNFIPKDRKESKIVHQIVQKFKEGMTPSFVKNASTVREMTIPDVFSIAYMHVNKQNSYLNKIGKCYLEKMDVTYGGDKFVTYNDAGKGPPPQKTTITLAFKELEIMDRSKVAPRDAGGGY